MKIAITAYVDEFWNNKFIDECNLMTFSGQDLDERFTFIIYAHPDVADYIDLYPNVKVFKYIVPEKKYYKDYRFAKSLVFPYDKPEYLEEYDYVCKTDTDVLFTSKMNEFPFNKHDIYIGRGRYTTNENQIKDYYVAARMFGFPEYKRISDMHSTIICSKENLIEIMRLSDDLCKNMYYGWQDDGEWGKSFFRGTIGLSTGICSMYAAEIILSSVYKEKNIKVIDTIDSASESLDYYKNYYHFHCYHHDFIYSKFQARYGSYNNLEYQAGNSAAAYCINLYLKRKKMGKENPELFKKPIFNNEPLPKGFAGIPQIKYNKEQPYGENL